MAGNRATNPRAGYLFDLCGQHELTAALTSGFDNGMGEYVGGHLVQ
jgi:hypothetical protein